MSITEHSSKNITRRQALQRGAAAGAVIWAVPMVASTTANAEGGGSSGARHTGRLESVTCVWDNTYFRPRQGTPSRPSHDYSNDTFCQINTGGAWRDLMRGDQFVIPAGAWLQMRPWRGHAGGETAEPSDGAPATPTPSPTSTTQPPTTTTVPAPTTTTEPPTPETTVASPAPTGTVDPTTSSTTVASTGGLTPASSEPPADSAPPAAPLPQPTSADAVDTIIIDMSGRTEIDVGDVYGYFTIVDAEPA